MGCSPPAENVGYYDGDNKADDPVRSMQSVVASGGASSPPSPVESPVGTPQTRERDLMPDSDPSTHAEDGTVGAVTGQTGFSHTHAANCEVNVPTFEGQQSRLHVSAAVPGAPRSSATAMGDSEANRMSFSSLYSLGSAVYNGTKGSIPSGPPSSTGGSEPDGNCLSSTFRA
jgi:hypothetical protein